MWIDRSTKKLFFFAAMNHTYYSVLQFRLKMPDMCQLALKNNKDAFLWILK